MRRATAGLYHYPIRMHPSEITRTRLRAGLSQAQLARVTGVRQATVSYWESGRHSPREVQLAMLERIREQLDRSAQEEVYRDALAGVLAAGVVGVLAFLFSTSDDD